MVGVLENSSFPSPYPISAKYYLTPLAIATFIPGFTFPYVTFRWLHFYPVVFDKLTASTGLYKF